MTNHTNQHEWSVGFPPLVLSDPLFQTTMFLSTFPAPKMNHTSWAFWILFELTEHPVVCFGEESLQNKLPDNSATRSVGFSQPPVAKVWSSKWISFSLHEYYRVETGKYYMTIWWPYDDYMMTILIKSADKKTHLQTVPLTVTNDIHYQTAWRPQRVRQHCRQISQGQTVPGRLCHHRKINMTPTKRTI